MACKKFAIAGVSRNKHKFGNTIYKELIKKDYDIVPVNPNMESFEGAMCYRSVAELPDETDALIIATKPETALELIKDASSRGIKNIFIQQGAQNKEIMELADRNGINLICKQCILMFANPTGIHKFHAAIARLFGLYPN